MRWANGVEYEGGWCAGAYHGRGRKAYSRGGAYDGAWAHGRRHGRGASVYDGKWGYDRWEGPFVDDKPHGVGTMRMRDASAPPVAFEFDRGEPVTRLET